MKITFDIDSTLANTDHRHHFLYETPKDWGGFFAASDKDTPIKVAIEVYRALLPGNSIEFWTGRPEYLRSATRAWLYTHLGPTAEYCPLKMREKNDRRDDNVIKLEFIDPKNPPDLIFEDRSRIVDAFRYLGYTVYQVAPGDF